MTVRPRVVVGAVLIEAVCVLAARRTGPSDHAAFWEFPGDKVEDDADPRHALTREIRDVLSASIAIAEDVSGDGAPWPISENHVPRLYLASVIHSDRLPGADHDLLRWLAMDELESVEWLPSDRVALPAARSALETAAREQSR